MNKKLWSLLVVLVGAGIENLQASSVPVMKGKNEIGRYLCQGKTPEGYNYGIVTKSSDGSKIVVVEHKPGEQKLAKAVAGVKNVQVGSILNSLYNPSKTKGKTNPKRLALYKYENDSVSVASLFTEGMARSACLNNNGTWIPGDSINGRWIVGHCEYQEG